MILIVLIVKEVKETTEREGENNKSSSQTVG